ncbi:uncharacterized protein BXZ73DRAFT_99070 [Epithele typhae]|uniref:uncharacterized protein n=1 Tax=Epithele typhae TaxID=378194 RepID=UPI0020087CBF|nr:uncharacterized protein BXZ73DRAFT_99070 [Epithele typhae]KAH9940070.1 hypothetical protein BXZ73DRAFT_99070 [Epithele typhae]
MSLGWLSSSGGDHAQFVLQQAALLTKLESNGIRVLQYDTDEFRPWKNDLSIPPYVAVASCAVLLLQLLFRSSRAVRLLLAKVSRSNTASETVEDMESTRYDGQSASNIARLGGPVMFTFKLVRFFCVLSLLSLSIMTLLVYDEDGNPRAPLKPRLTALALAGVYVYASLLAFVSVVARRTISNVVIKHLNTILVVLWLVYSYRDLWPLATYTLTPGDASEGALLWAKIGVLTFTAVFIPLFMPRQYIPVDSKDPAPEPNPEQTASIASVLTYCFLDSIVFKAYKLPHLGWDQLPPQADYDYAKNLVKRAFPHMDPFQVHKKRHLLIGFITVFRNEFVILFLMLTLRVAGMFASPVGIFQLLKYIEEGGEGATVRPWFWVSWLFIGPVLGSVAIQFYIFTATRMLVRTDAIITQLIFDHSLRIRVKSEASPESPAASRPPTAVHTPDNSSVTEPADAEESTGSDENRLSAVSESETVRASIYSDASTTVPSSSGASPKKGKDKKKIAVKVDNVLKPDADADGGSNLVGKINNLVTTDLQNLGEGREILFLVYYGPLSVVVSMVFLYAILDWAAVVGFIATIALFPLPGVVASKMQAVQKERMKKTDARVQNVTETMNVIRMIKLFGWEPRVADRIGNKREDELSYIRWYRFLELTNGNINYLIPIVTMIVTYSTYTLIMGRELTASRVFSSMSVFDIIRNQLHTTFDMIPQMITAKVSLDRVSAFLDDTELLDEFSERTAASSEAVVPPHTTKNPTIGICSASFTWSNENDGTLTPGPNRRNFTLRIDEEVVFRRGRINLIVGPTGSGKTSLLMALLGELHYIPNGPESYVSLPRAGGVAYAAQESWVQNETIRDNILFGSPFDEERYNKVIAQCALKRDLTLFEAGDQTEVGEKGLTLSGGQKARITLARAVYSKADVILLDDVLAALDVHTARWIVDNCMKGDLLKGRTVLLVTHNVAMASPIADFVVSLGTDGRVASQGSFSKVIARDDKLLKEFTQEQAELAKADVDAEDLGAEGAPKKSDGKLILKEEVSEGHVGWDALSLYLGSMGGRHNVLFWIAIVGFFVLCETFNTFDTFWLGHWATQYEENSPGEVNVLYYIVVYTILMLLSVTSYCIGYVVHVFGALRASRTIHKSLINSILSSTLRWLDQTPASRIITRCTQDIQSVDGIMPRNLEWVIELTIVLVIKFLAVVYFSPIFLLPGLVVTLLGGWCGQIYMKAQLSVKREMSNHKAPVLGHFGAAISGLASIRAYGAQERFRMESYARLNKYVRAGRTYYNLNRWVSLRVEALGALFAAGLALYLVYGTRVRAANTGFSLNMAVAFSNMILWWIRLLNEFEVNGNSVERIQQYLDIEHESVPVKDAIPPAYWPASGSLRVEKLCARYSTDGPRVLHEISFEVKAGERVGIVGRTGSGKSSLTLALLRLILTEGKVYYDGIATDSINLDALRSNITIIPQVPELLSGTLRQNLDPFSQYDDVVLNDALRAAGLFSLQDETDEGRITLDSPISSGGSNLSVGQRQILALARAIVRQSKLLILDEATSAIDYETDEIIQQSLRQELGSDVTLLTIAHRLQTIMDADKILVLDGGNIVEFGAPAELLKNEQGTLRALVDESGDKEKLYEMAKASSRS